MTDTDDTSTWDLAAAIGATAMMSAAVRARATADGMLHDPLAEPLIRAIGADLYLRIVSGEANTAATDLLVAATRYFDDFLAAAGRAGIRQAVIVASRLDTRPYRLWWPAGTTVYELDQPEVLEFKTATLRGLGATPSVHRRAVGVDLRQDWPTALRQIGFDAAQPSVWVIEGVLGLVPAEQQGRLLDGVTALSAAGSRLGADVGRRGDASARHLREGGWATVTTSTADVFSANGFLAPTVGAVAGAPASYLHATRAGS